MERKETLQTLNWENKIGVSVANSQLNKQPIKLNGITTSQVQQALKSANPYPARVFIREPDKNCLECANHYEEKGCQACQTPVFFRIKDQANNWIKPKISKGSLIAVTGNYAENTNGNTRPSFTATSYQLLEEPKPLNTAELITLTSNLLSTTLEKYKEWTQRKDFLFKKLEELKEIETLTKLGDNFLQAYLTLKKAHYANYQEKHLNSNFSLPYYLTTISTEIQLVQSHIETYQRKEK